MSSIHLAKDAELLTNLRRAAKPIVVAGVTGEETLKYIGDMGPFKDAWYHPNGPCNLVSYGRAKRDGAERVYDQYWDEDILTINGERFIFSRRHRGSNTYSCDFTSIAYNNLERADHEVAMGNFETVEKRKKLYSNFELEMAAEAKELFARMAYPSIKNVITLLRKGKIRNCNVTPRDVLNAIDIHGKDLAEIRGRTTRGPRPAVRPQVRNKPITGEEDVDLYVDIMFVQKVMFLVTVGAPMRYIMVSHIASK
jgi:hypothetical protein